MTAPVSIEQQAEEVLLSAIEYEAFIRQVGFSKDPRAQRTPEQIAIMNFRLERKHAAAETLRRLVAGPAHEAAE